MANKTKINELLRELFALSKKLSFADLKLKDGSILRTTADTFDKGAQVTIVSADGAESAAPEGDVTAEDGTVLTIKSGVIENVGTAPAPAEEKMEAPAPEAPVEDDSAENLDPSMLMDTIKNLIDRVAALEESYASTSMTVEKMSAQPASKPFSFDPHGDFKFKEGTIGFELEKFKAEKKAKSKANELALAKFNEVLKEKKSNKTTQSFSSSKLDLGMNSFTIE